MRAAGTQLTGLGLDPATTEAAITGLPAAVTQAFSAYTAKLGKWIERARAVGHEVLLGVPMEAVDLPRSAPGPRALLTSLSSAENLDRLHRALGRAPGFVGVVGIMGSRFLASGDALGPVLVDLRGRGLMFLDSRVAARSAAPAIAAKTGLVRASNAVVLGSPPSQEALDDRLAEAVRIEKAKGGAVAMASPLPVTLQRIARWTREANRRGIALAPITALAGNGAGDKRSGRGR